MNRFDSVVMDELRRRDRDDVAVFVKDHCLGNSRALAPAEAAREAGHDPDPNDQATVERVADGYVEHVDEQRASWVAKRIRNGDLELWRAIEPAL